ncbi:MAG: T9SS type A sorting domain-containing protein [Winogradskyella sp.]|uniref:T9SS type A sorting domain-containing protein n=1 Tax=Winogradskyella sp. TaxID=1883156 RepID=UPI00260132FA|nr:T9SS type A sorting domain-containing protein [Winogradskyella sp.]NRB59068.1 T9SS type A sorting domain-containing protein [Winogradskyella sp.]
MKFPQRLTRCFKVLRALKCAKNLHVSITFVTLLSSTFVISQTNSNVTLDSNSPYLINNQVLGRTLVGGDTIFISSERVNPIKFEFLEGNNIEPIVIINKDGQVQIDGVSNNSWGALTFENCKHIKVSGKGHPGFKYGFELSGLQSGLAFTELSSNCEAEGIKISHDGFFGIYAKKDYNGNPPSPHPVFENLVIHDCFIENVSEGMYIGETKTPGMEFIGLKIYNNIVRNTQRESIQIANAIQDVEIYNNTLLNAGLEGENFHMNILQIGDNSVAEIYNNILIDAPDYGVINFGKGDVHVFNNYIANCKGVFSDNRTISDISLNNSISANYFKSTLGYEIIRNMNEFNALISLDNIYDIDISFYKDLNGVDNETISNNYLSTVNEITFNDPSTNDYALASGISPEYENLGADGGPEILPYDDPATTSRQLVISSDMINDEVIGGSIFSPIYLFDEQSTDIEANEHPISKSWKPFYYMNADSYHTTVDLGDEHHISQINLHDMHDTHEFVVEYYDGTSWINLITDPCDNFNTWKTYDTEITTRYLRFSMYNSPYAAVNEIIIFGYPLVKDSQQILVDSSMVTDLVNGSSVDSPLYLFDEQSIDINSNAHPISKSWKPFYNETKAPYHAIINLNGEYRISEIALHDMHNTKDFIVEASTDGENWDLLFTEQCDGFKVWQKHETNVITKFLRFTMLESPYASVNEILIYGYPIMSLPVADNSIIESQIVVTPEMVDDLVIGGSVDSPLYLFDEQESVNPEINEHPTSKNWKPFYNNSKAPYYATVDFGEEYHISKIYMHDMHSSGNFIIEYQDNSQWLPLITEPCNSYNTWKLHETDIDASRLRLVMLDSPYVGVNEIIFIGYPNGNVAEVQQKVFLESTDAKSIDLNSIEVYPNPVKDIFSIKLPNITKDEFHNVKIIDASGKIVFDKDYNYTNTLSVSNIDSNSILKQSGLYLLVYTNDSGIKQSLKIIKE